MSPSWDYIIWSVMVGVFIAGLPFSCVLGRQKELRQLWRGGLLDKMSVVVTTLILALAVFVAIGVIRIGIENGLAGKRLVI